jgi:hypothetical protein
VDGNVINFRIKDDDDDDDYMISLVVCQLASCLKF